MIANTIDCFESIVNIPLSGVSLQFLKDGQQITTSSTNPSGETSIQWTYPNDGQAHALSVRINPSVSTGKKMLVSQPVTLTVGKETRLLITVERQESSTSHTKLTHNSGGVGGKTIKKVNDAEYSKITDGNGLFILTLDIQPENENATVYQISASFEGDNNKTATAHATAPGGQDIIVCQTIQYGYMPSSNSTSLTVEHQSSSVVLRKDQYVSGSSQ